MSNLSASSLLTQDEHLAEPQLLAQATDLVNNRAATRQGRRNFLTGLTAAAAAAGTLGLAGCSNDGSVGITTVNNTPSVLDVLNFALNLEYLEANFYAYLYTGSGLSTTDNGGTPTITGGAKYTSSTPSINILLQNLYTEEQAHVQFLRATIASALASTPVACPSLNLAALGAVTTDATFLAIARQLEAVGVSAYAGAAQYLTSSTAALTYAAQILHVESQHAGALRQLCIQYNVTSGAVDSQDTVPSLSAIFNVSATTGLTPARTTSQVLQIVYAKAGTTGVSSGGFYPNGLNGNIKTS